MLNSIRKVRAERALARRLLAEIVARAREPIFFEQFKVPDTIDGRFDLLALHAWMVLEQLGTQGNRTLQQRLTDLLFTSFDEGLREQGAGDIGMGRRMKAMADAFYGRLGGYRGALGPSGLLDAVIRNVYRGDAQREPEARCVASYVETARASVAAMDLASGALDFGRLPGP